MVWGVMKSSVYKNSQTCIVVYYLHHCNLGIIVFFKTLYLVNNVACHLAISYSHFHLNQSTKQSRFLYPGISVSRCLMIFWLFNICDKFKINEHISWLPCLCGSNQNDIFFADCNGFLGINIVASLSIIM